MKTQRLYEHHFLGQSNAGLRAKIRAAASGACCGPANEEAVLAMRDTVALTSTGEASLRACAADYRAVCDYNPRCGCDACYAGNLQRLGAL